MDSDSRRDFKDRPVRLSLQLIVKRHMPGDAHSWSHEKITEFLNKITHLRLDRENIGEIDNLELLGTSVTNVYLQENCITVLQNLDCLQNLQFLTLSGNKILKVENLRQLSHLLFLDLSNNCIDHLVADELPLSLIILNLMGNPCCSKCGYREAVIKHLSKLKQLDLEEIDGEENTEESEYEDEATERAVGEEEVTATSNRSSGSLYRNRLPNMEACLQDFTTEVLLRSQDRMEESLQMHHCHKLEMDSLRIKHHIKPSS